MSSTASQLHRLRTTTAQKVNDVKVIQVSSKLCQQEWTCNKQHIRKCNLAEHLECVCAVNTCTLIQIRRNIHQKTCTDQHNVWNTNPAVEDNNQYLCNRRICPEWNCLINPSPSHQITVDQTIRRKHLSDIQKRYKLRYSDGHNQDGSPELLELNPFLVDQHRHNHA